MTRNLYVDIHILQTVPPSNLNRDDAGSPKQAVYGGVRRSRVSSQAWKRATRRAFVDALPETDLGTRTKRIGKLLADRLAALYSLDGDQSKKLAIAMLGPLGITPSQKKADETSYLLFFGHRQLDAIAELVRDRVGELVTLEPKELATALKDLPVTDELRRTHPIDVALFGRMVANMTNLNVDAATQVAHALSTHAVDLEFDYYTAVDDEKPKDEDAGAGMIGTVEFNSATLYRYATINIRQLQQNLADATATAEAVDLFLSAFSRSMPTGHQNTFAHRTLPSAVVVMLRTDQPINLVSAFERPVLPGHSGIIERSLTRLAEEAATVTELWQNPADLTVAAYLPIETGQDKISEALGASTTFPALLTTVRGTVDSWLAAEAAQ
ncbi:type I-E CRISPR-associated protein Cas7/Cse4/CasC [Actinosynnema sp. ALI-1.44]|uniref:type I-E CRISPR-associated protein Cas7/Cse4/CasC n=1 Tax=Actinosynnema sp. ALI-1.44 TaxID=1933779 RepID=UPI00097BC4FB|nr:type I-E CRISPR-associated protein Cas7/Cse4/CasC [Actinosynnema sp. ALI-1.44]ONI91976.1 type I-E CRISPR-associated protein Cas7/Cse4/CasC [Actinosynnema sp. ALI-1.44]